MAKETPPKEQNDELLDAINKTTDHIVSLVDSVANKLAGYPAPIRETIVGDTRFKTALTRITGAKSGGGTGTGNRVSDKDIEKLLKFCETPRTPTEIHDEIGFSLQTIIKRCDKLVEEKKLKKTDGKYQATK